MARPFHSSATVTGSDERHHNEVQPSKNRWLEDDDPYIAWMREAWRIGELDRSLLGEELYRLSDSVGQLKANNRRDVAKVQALLDLAGAYDLTPTNGPTGYFGSSQHRSIMDYQRNKGLKVDGWLYPDGETIRSLESNLSGRSGRSKSDLAQDRHDDERQRVSTPSPDHGSPSKEWAQSVANAGIVHEPLVQWFRNGISSDDPTQQTLFSDFLDALRQRSPHVAKELLHRAGPSEVNRKASASGSGAIDKADTKPSDAEETDGHSPGPVEYLFPPHALTEERLKRFRSRSGYSLVRTKSGDFELQDPGAGKSLAVLSKDTARGLVRSWDRYSDRVALLSIVGRTGMSVEEQLRLAEPFFSKVDPVDSSLTKTVGSAGRAGVLARIKMQQKLADDERAAFVKAATALDDGADRKKVLSQLRKDILRDLDANFTVLEFLADLTPGLGNLRSFRHAQNDFEEAAEAEGWNEFGHYALGGVDLLGVVPGLNAVKVAGRSAVKLTPYGERVVADRALRRLERKFSDKNHPVDPKRLFGDVWVEVPARARRRVQFDANMALGSAGEKQFTGLARKADPDAEIQAIKTLSEPGVPKKRVYDFVKREVFDSIRQDLRKKITSVTGKEFEPISVRKFAYEGKVGATDKRSGQLKFDEAVKNRKDLAEKMELNDVRDIRVFPESIPAKLAIADFEERIPSLIRDRVVDQETADALLGAFKKSYARGLTKVLIDDYAGLIARLSATAPHHGALERTQ